jgi:hypothetical protein
MMIGLKRKKRNRRRKGESTRGKASSWSISGCDRGDSTCHFRDSKLALIYMSGAKYGHTRLNVPQLLHEYCPIAKETLRWSKNRNK